MARGGSESGDDLGITQLFREHSGDPQLDAAIAAYRNGPLTKQMKTRELRDPQWAAGACHHETELFVCFLHERGIEAFHSDDRERGIGDELAPEVQALFAEPRRLDLPTPEQHGYTDRTIEGRGEHCAAIVPLPSGTYMVDFTAAQYGYRQAFPLVQRLDDEGRWQRQW